MIRTVIIIRVSAAPLMAKTLAHGLPRDSAATALLNRRADAGENTAPRDFLQDIGATMKRVTILTAAIVLASLASMGTGQAQDSAETFFEKLFLQ